MRSLIILGAADGAMATYRRARTLGYRTIAVDLRPTAPGVALADEYLPISTREAGRIGDALAGRGDLAGVLAPSSDIALPAQMALAERLGLPCGLTDAAVRASVDKRFFRTVCEELGLPSYAWMAGNDGDELSRRAAGFSLPIVVKPADAQSSRGITRCADLSMVDAAVRAAREHSYSGAVVLEEEVHGWHCGCECVIDDGRVVFLALTERLITPPPLAVTTAHLLPAQLPDGVHERVVRTVDDLCAHLGYQRGPLNLDLVIDPDGVPYLIEMGARTGGDPLGDLVRRCHGVDPVAASINAAVDSPILVTPVEPAPVMARNLSAGRAGMLVAVHGLTEATAVPEVRELVLLAEPGRSIQANTDMASKVGYVMLAGDPSGSLDELRRTAERVVRTVRFEIVGEQA